MQHFTYKYWSTTQTKGGAIWQLKGATKRETLKAYHFFFSLNRSRHPPSFIRFFPSSRQPRAWLFGRHTSLPFSATSSFPLQPAQHFPHFLSSPSQLFPSSSGPSLSGNTNRDRPLPFALWFSSSSSSDGPSP